MLIPNVASISDTTISVVSDYDVRHMYEILYDIYMGLDLDVKSNGGH